MLWFEAYPYSFLPNIPEITGHTLNYCAFWLAFVVRADRWDRQVSASPPLLPRQVSVSLVNVWPGCRDSLDDGHYELRSRKRRLPQTASRRQRPGTATRREQTSHSKTQTPRRSAESTSPKRWKLCSNTIQEHLRVYKSSDSPLTLPETNGSSISENAPLLTAKEPKAIDDLVSERDDLLRENAAMRQENQEMAELVKEYEKGLETATSLIRDHAVPPSPLASHSQVFCLVYFRQWCLFQFQASIRTTQLHKEYNDKLNIERLENERLQNAVIDAEARLINVSGLLRQAHSADHEADRSVDQALLDLQTQNRGLRLALGLPVDAPIDVDKDLVFLANDGVGGARSK